METLIGAGILLVGVASGVLLHAWAWGGRFVKRPVRPTRPDVPSPLQEAMDEILERLPERPIKQE